MRSLQKPSDAASLGSKASLRTAPTTASKDRTMDITFETAEALLAAYRRRDLSPVEVVEAYLARIEALNPHLGVYITLSAEQALEAAQTAEARYAGDDAVPGLLGVPVALKDTEFTGGLRTTQGSRVYETFVPDSDSVLVERLKRAGAVVLGKTNTPELGMGGETVNPITGHCRNPWDPQRTSGGSSGGSAAAVAAGMACLASGSDGAGSITIPAAFCGVFGVKPTQGTIPYWPMPKTWPSFLEAGPIARRVGDAALFLRATGGFDARDPLSRRQPPPGTPLALRKLLPGLKVAWTEDMGYAVVDREVAAAARATATSLKDYGIEIEETHPALPYPFDIWPTIARVEEYSAFGDLLEDHAERLTPQIRERLEIGRSLSGSEYLRCYQEMLRFRRAMEAFFDRYDLLLAPLNAVPAFDLDTPPSMIAGRAVKADWEGFTPFAICANLTGQPAATVPCGFSSSGLPIGLMAIAGYGKDDVLLALCAALEEARPWRGVAPQLPVEPAD